MLVEFISIRWVCLCGQRSHKFRFCRIFPNFHVFFTFLRHANKFRCCYAPLFLFRRGPAPNVYEQVRVFQDLQNAEGIPISLAKWGLGGPHITGSHYRAYTGYATVYTDTTSAAWPLLASQVVLEPQKIGKECLVNREEWKCTLQNVRNLTLQSL